MKILRLQEKSKEWGLQGRRKVRISNHLKLTKNNKYVCYYKPRILSKAKQKEVYKIKGKVIKEKRNCWKIKIQVCDDDEILNKIRYTE